MGLRDLKKQQTRERITAAAWELFADRGYDKVTVADVARRAEVSLATVFNYFADKEELFYGPLEAFGERLVEAVRTREAGVPVGAAVWGFLQRSDGLLARIEAGDTAMLARIRAVNRVIAESPALQARELRALSRTTDRLAALIVAETGAHEVHAQVVANALLGVHRALLLHVRRKVLAGDDVTRLATEVQRLGQDAFDMLERACLEAPVNLA